MYFEKNDKFAFRVCFYSDFLNDGGVQGQGRYVFVAGKQSN